MNPHHKPYPSSLTPGGTPRFTLTSEDRILTQGIEWRWSMTNAVGHVLRPADGLSPAQTISHEDFHLRLGRGLLDVQIGYYAPGRAEQRQRETEQILATLPEPALRRILARETWATKFLEFERAGRVVRTHASITAATPDMTAEIIKDMVAGRTDGKRRHVGQRLDVDTPPSSKSILTWARDYQFGGLAALQDDRAQSGNRISRFHADEIALLAKVVRGYMDPRRPSKNKIVKDVVERFAAENEARVKQGLVPFKTPGKEAVFREIDALPRFEVDVARFGYETAVKKHQPVGAGLVVELPLERVEMDEWTTDLHTHLARAGLHEKLSPELWAKVEKFRWIVTLAIDVATRCTLAMRLSRTPSAETAIATLEMIGIDKKQWADAVGALSPWNMYGTPVTIATDNGPAFKSFEFRLAANAIGTELVRPVAGLPHLRPYVERIFGKASTALMERLTGRTYADVVERGEYDSEKNAVHDEETLGFALVRYFVDVHHNTPCPELGGETPLQAWQRLQRTKGPPPPPSLTRRRLAFGTRLTRTVTNRGVRVLNVDYSNQELQRWLMGAGERDVELRWLASDIGSVAVKLGNRFFEVPAVHDVFHGVSANAWLAAGKDLRARMKNTKEINAHIVHEAIRAIEAVDKAARARVDLVVPDWSPARIAHEERRLFTGFRISEPAMPGVAVAHGDILADAVPAGGKVVPADAAAATREPRGGRTKSAGPAKSAVPAKPAALAGAAARKTPTPAKTGARKPIKPTRLT